ncbi:hypothetical protein [Pseudomonas sp. NA-150]|uniref:hypothetical protein n=1 Tax=Pseudomonas sp. NA-150 TaxID=3367525 RepID=UPI0037C54792
MHTCLDLPALTHLAQRSAAVTQPCTCTPKSLAGWEGMPVSLKEAQLREIATLVFADEEESTLDEYHPQGTYYWSLDAPIAPMYFPYNRCGVWECIHCQRCFLRYAEAGAYHLESRIRSLNPALIVDAPHADNGRAKRAEVSH